MGFFMCILTSLSFGVKTTILCCPKGKWRLLAITWLLFAMPLLYATKRPTNQPESLKLLKVRQKVFQQICLYAKIKK